MSHQTHQTHKRSPTDYFAAVAAALIAVACGTTVNVFSDGNQKEDGGAKSATDCASDPASCKATAQALGRIKNVDILFVMDKSGSMLDEQARLAQEMPKLIKALVTGDRDGDGISELTPAESIHLGVVTSDMGVPGIGFMNSADAKGCLGQGDDGILQNLPHPNLESPTPENPNPEPTSDPSCPALYPEPYVTHVTGKDDPDKTAANFGCLLRVGADGCGFEQPLEAALKALWPSDNHSIKFLGDTQGHGDLENKGFLRDDSLLAIVVVTDEDDCSIGAQGNANLLAVSSSNLLPDFLRSDPMKAAKVNMRCAYDDELPKSERNRWPIDRYLKGFQALRPNMKDRVIFGVIGGIPVDLVDPSSDLPQTILGDITADPSDIVTYYSNILDDPRMAQEEDLASGDGKGGYLKKSCLLNNQDYDSAAAEGTAAAEPYTTVAEPGRRFVELAKAFGVNGVVQSICEPLYASPVALLATALTNCIASSVAQE